MGVGKTSIARKAASASQMLFWDCDALIFEYSGETIESIFEKYGEQEFRNWEHQVLIDAVSNTEPAIISTGGGVVLRQDNRRLLTQNAIVVWLKGDLRAIAHRLAQSPNPRPLVPKGDVSEMEATLTDLFAARRHLYKEVADYTLDVSDMRQSAVVNAVLDIVEEMQENNSP